MQALPLIAELEAALTSGANARRVDMLTRLTELFAGDAARYSEEQIGVFDHVMVRLVSTVDANARAKLAHRLAPIANAPSSLIHMLAFDDDIEVARPILIQSERLAGSALRANTATKSQQHLLAIAQRRSLSEAVTDVLIERGDREVLRSVVNNVGSRFSEAGCHMLVERAAGDDDLATTIGLRSPTPRSHFPAPVEKASIAANKRLAAENVPATSVRGGGVAEGTARTVSPHFAAVQAGAQSQNRVGRIGEAELYRYARDRKFEEAVLALSILCDTPIDLVERALLDPTAEIILVLAKVADLSSTTTKAILLLRAADRRMSATDLDQALSNFERLQAATARRVLDFFRTRLKKPAKPMISPAVAVNV
jgi:uncharacterized protein (DUF2336 family)